MTARRVVSLVPSITESLRHWGLDPIACTDYCEQPDLPTVGGTKNPDIAAIVALAPDVVMMDREENRRPDAEALVAAGLTVEVVAVRSVADVAPALARLAVAAGLGQEPTITLSERAPDAVRRRAFVPIWRRPWMTIGGGTYGSDLLARLGVDTVFADHPDDYPTVELDDVVGTEPDLVLAPSEPYSFRPAHIAELEAVAPVVEVDGQDLFWWGTRTPEAFERLRAQLAPHMV